MRTTTLILISVVLAVLLGLGTAQLLTTTFAWNPDNEFQPNDEFLRIAQKIGENPNAKVEIGETVYDFGIMDKGDKGKHTFTLKNVGTAVLTLEPNQTTCTCTGIDVEPKRVSPGGTAKITLHWDAERTTGKYNQGGTVVTNDPDNREVFYSIQGLFVSSVMFSPNSLVFPSIAATATKSGTVRIYGFEPQPLEILDVDWPDKEHFDVRVEPTELTDADRENHTFKNAQSAVEMTVSVKPGLPFGPFSQRIVLTTNSAREPKAEYSVSGQVHGDNIAIGGTIYHRTTGMLVPGKTVRGKSLIRDFSISLSGLAAENAQLTLREVVPDWLKVTVSEPLAVGRGGTGRKIHTVTLEIPADAPACHYAVIEGPGSAYLLFDTGMEQTPILRIPLQLTVE